MSRGGSARFDLLAFGRIGVDVYPLQTGVGLADVTSFGKFLGGTAANVAVAGARHGLRAGLVSRVGDDPFGGYLRSELDRLGVEPSMVGIDPILKTPVTFCEIYPPDDFPLYFYREPKAPDLNVGPDDVDLGAVRDARIVWITATGLSQDPSRALHHRILRERTQGHTVLDLDYRSTFWRDPGEAGRELADVLGDVTVAIGNREECHVAVGEVEPHRAADALLDRGVEIAIVKQGPRGVLAKTRDETVEVPPVHVDVVNGLGAGDAFGGALCRGIAAGWSLDRMVRFANAAGAIVASRLECSTAMPTTAEVDVLLERSAA